MSIQPNIWAKIIGLSYVDETVIRTLCSTISRSQNIAELVDGDTSPAYNNHGGLSGKTFRFFKQTCNSDAGRTFDNLMMIFNHRTDGSLDLILGDQDEIIYQLPAEIKSNGLNLKAAR